MFKIEQYEKEVLRMELQMSELIRIAANLNERLKVLEDRAASNLNFQRIGAKKKVH